MYSGKGKGKYVSSGWRLSCLSNYFEMSWFLFSIPPIDSALKAIVICYPTKGTVSHFFCLRIPWPILTVTNKPGVMGEVPQLCSAVEGGVWGLSLFFSWILQHQGQEYPHCLLRPGLSDHVRRKSLWLFTDRAAAPTSRHLEVGGLQPTTH